MFIYTLGDIIQISIFLIALIGGSIAILIAYLDDKKRFKKWLTKKW